jgi:hypothetical protein
MEPDAAMPTITNITTSSSNSSIASSQHGLCYALPAYTNNTSSKTFS